MVVETGYGREAGDVEETEKEEKNFSQNLY